MPLHVNKFKVSKAGRTMNEVFCRAVARILAKTLPILTLGLSVFNPRPGSYSIPALVLTGAEIAYSIS
jgi:hypothetical protein